MWAQANRGQRACRESQGTLQMLGPKHRGFMSGGPQETNLGYRKAETNGWCPEGIRSIVGVYCRGHLCRTPAHFRVQHGPGPLWGSSRDEGQPATLCVPTCEAKESGSLGGPTLCCLHFLAAQVFLISIPAESKQSQYARQSCTVHALTLEKPHC